MSAKPPAPKVHIPDATGAPGEPTAPDVREVSEEHQHPKHNPVTSPAAVLKNDRMHLAAKPNAGEPLSHRNRSKAGRKG